MQDADRKNLGKNLSGYSNASGGVLVWGVKAKNVDERNPQAKAFDFSPIPNIRRFHSDLNSYDGQVVQRVVSGVEHHLIELTNGSGYAITLVPESDRKPHMSIASDDKRYYLRSGSQTLAIDHVLVEALMSIQSKPELEIVVTGASVGPGSGPHMHGLARAFLALRNSGSVAARNVAITLISKDNRVYNGQLDFSIRSIVNIRDSSGLDIHAQQFRMAAPYLLYPGVIAQNIEIVQHIKYSGHWDDLVDWTIHAENFVASGTFSIDPDQVKII